MKILGFRHIVTGGTRHRFFTEDERDICEVWSSLPAPDQTLMTIAAGKRRLECRYDLESTIVPGLTRFVWDTEGAPTEPAWLISMLDLDDIILYAEGRLVHAVHGERMYTLESSAGRLGTVRDVSLTASLEDGLHFVADAAPDADPALLLPILTYPLLTFLP